MSGTFRYWQCPLSVLRLTGKSCHSSSSYIQQSFCFINITRLYIHSLYDHLINSSEMHNSAAPGWFSQWKCPRSGAVRPIIRIADLIYILLYGLIWPYPNPAKNLMRKGTWPKIASHRGVSELWHRRKFKMCVSISMSRKQQWKMLQKLRRKRIFLP